MKCGLLGRKLGHSYSPDIHASLASYSYELFEREPEALEEFLKNGDFSGINVTIPYKKAVIPYLDALSPIAERLGAVNTVVRREGNLIGHNTDYFGFRYLVEKSGLVPKGKKCLVLGSGGASVTVCAVLRELGGEAVVISRSGENNYGNLERHADAAILVNTTPVGMYPNVEEAPVDLGRLPMLEGVLDIVYNPARTRLLMDAESRGLTALGGLWMLVAQAKEAAEWFTGKPIPDGKIAPVHQALRRQMENIILIGMPGCGKSTVGTALAGALGKEFVDADAALEARFGRKITDIIPHDGESAFRAMETEVLAELGKRSGLVIATGGGCVTQERNYPLLHRNGTIFWLRRDVSKLPTDGRPLSQVHGLTDLYRVRKPMYQRFSDFVIDNNGTPETTVSAILAILEETI